jgi:hypothetical protein
MSHRRQLLALVVALLFANQACSLGISVASPEASAPTPAGAAEVAEPTATEVPPTATSVPPTPTVAHLAFPGEPPAEQFFLSDVQSGGGDELTRAAAGDNFSRNRLERPFGSDMTYRPDLDLVRVGISADDTWYYFTLRVYGAGASIYGPYAIELDLDGDGRGEFLIRAGAPASTDWTTGGVQVLADLNEDIGGARPMESDPPDPSRDGYETVVFDQGQGADPDTAWARLVPSGGPGLQLAVKRSFVGDPAFLWSGWADEGVDQPGWFDYNDHFTPAEAGSLQSGLGAVYAVDSTCRMYFGYTPSGNEPGLCLVTGTVRNCSPHPMRMEPGGKKLTPWFEGGAILTNVPIGTYRFYDESTGDTLVLTATLSPGGTITITKTGLGDTYPCQ